MSKRLQWGGVFGVAVVAAVWWISTAPPAHGADPELPSKWSLTKEFPAVKDPDGGPGAAAERLTVGVEGGWVVVRLLTADDVSQVAVVLARATDPKPPVVTIDPKFRSFEVRYRGYFVKEHVGRLRVYREQKTSDALAWPALKGDPKEDERSRVGTLRMTQHDEAVWLSAGAVEGRPDVRFRFQHAELRANGNGVQLLPGGLMYCFYGVEGKCEEDGELLTAHRITFYNAEYDVRALKLKAEFGTKPPPALDAKEWFNAPAPLALDKLQGKVILLDFWGQWCGPCVAKLPAVQALHEKYQGRGLVVVGVHSADRADDLAAFLGKKKVTFPVLLDTEKTAARYLVGSYPMYFLIDKSGKVVSGFTNDPPTAERIEALLDEKPEPKPAVKP